MHSTTNSRIIATEKMKRGEITADQANVLMVQLEGVRVIRAKLMANVRRALNQAVKNKELGHIKKDGLKPEVYHHINARATAIEIREREMREKLGRLSNVFAGDPIF